MQLVLLSHFLHYVVIGIVLVVSPAIDCGAIVVGSAGLKTQFDSSVDPVVVIVQDRSPAHSKMKILVF